MQTITLLNRKGGVGKTSSVFHLGGTLARGGRRVLVVDADPQANLTAGLLGADVARELSAAATIAALFDPDLDPFPEAVIRPTPVTGLSILPGSAHLDTHNRPDPHEPGPHHGALRDFLTEVAGEFDLTLIDCPPTIYRASWSALAASDHVVVPVQAEDFGSQGIVSILDALETVRATVNPSLNLLGFLLTMFNKSLGVHAAYAEGLRRHYGDLVFTATMPLSKDYKEAVAARKPIAVYKPRSAASKATQALADELSTRIEAADSTVDVPNREVA
ncbi:MAG: ParA family protein [Isosphaeraceae bacterium]